MFLCLSQFHEYVYSNAANRRSDSLKFLREVKAAQLDSSVDPLNKPSKEKVRAAVADYEMALKEELSLRTIIPGVRLVAPNDPKKKEEDISAAKQFLGLDLRDEDDKNADDNDNEVKQPEEERKLLLLQSRRRFDGKGGNSDVGEKDNGLSNSSKVVLLIIAVTQILLLFALSFDPMQMNENFTGIAGLSDITISFL